MVRVGGGEVKSKAKRKEEHDEAEQEQLGRIILMTMIIDINEVFEKKVVIFHDYCH